LKTAPGLSFFNFDEEQIVKQLEQRKDFDPYYALYLLSCNYSSMLKKDLNGFTQKHVDFYYKEVLGLQPFKGKPDEVHVILSWPKM